MRRLELYEHCKALLEQAGVEDADFDALCIFQDMLGDKHPLFRPQEEVTEETEQRILSLVSERCTGRPLQYLLGQWEFFGYPFFVGEGVLIPRPATETLVENVIEICRREKLTSPHIIDLCSGSGCIAVSLKKQLPFADVTAIELSEKAYGYLERNISLNDAEIHTLLCSVTDPETASRFSGADIIVTNPPYLTPEEMASLQREVRYEPEQALAGGSDGLDFYRIIASLWRESLRTGGWLCCEFGDGQHDDVKKILLENSYGNITLCRDLAGIIRTASAQKQEDVNG